MRSLMRHISGRETNDPVDDLDIVVAPEIAALVRVVAVPGNEKPQRDAFQALQSRGMFVDVLYGRADASHTLMTPRAVYVLQLNGG